MSSYNSIEKIKYTEDLSDAVSLDEYIVFANERNELKYIVFKFSNNVNQQLLGMKFEVSQYDMHDNLIERSVVIYNNFLAKANSSFVPKAKLRVLYACKRISVRLIQAAFDRVMWNEGEYVDNTYKFEHFARDERYIEEKDRPKASPKPTPAPKRKKERGERFTSRNIMKKNIAVFPKVFYWLTSILLLVAMGLAIWVFPNYSKQFTLKGYELEIIADDLVTIRGYEGDEKELTVPDNINGYKVTRIGKDAFRYLSATKITLPESVTQIEAGAFKNLKALKTVTCTSTSLTVEALAFENVTSLTEFDMAGATLKKNCFSGCGNLSKITFARTDVEKFVDLFDEKIHLVTVWTFNGTYNESETFFDGAKLGWLR